MDRREPGRIANEPISEIRAATRQDSRWSATCSISGQGFWSFDRAGVGRIPYLNGEPFFHRLEGVGAGRTDPPSVGESDGPTASRARTLSLRTTCAASSPPRPLPYGIGGPTGDDGASGVLDRPLSGVAQRAGGD